jgi:hypothetical protein
MTGCRRRGDNRACRRLRVFAFDPTPGVQPDTIRINEVTKPCCGAT